MENLVNYNIRDCSTLYKLYQKVEKGLKSINVIANHKNLHEFKTAASISYKLYEKNMISLSEKSLLSGKKYHITNDGQVGYASQKT